MPKIVTKNVFNVKSDTRLLNYQGGPIIDSHDAEDVWKREYKNNRVDKETIDLTMDSDDTSNCDTDMVSNPSPLLKWHNSWHHTKLLLLLVDQGR